MLAVCSVAVCGVQGLVRVAVGGENRHLLWWQRVFFFLLFISEETAQEQTKRENKKARYSLLLTAKEWSKGKVNFSCRGVLILPS